MEIVAREMRLNSSADAWTEGLLQLQFSAFRDRMENDAGEANPGHAAAVQTPRPGAGRAIHCWRQARPFFY